MLKDVLVETLPIAFGLVGHNRYDYGFILIEKVDNLLLDLQLAQIA